MVSSFRQNVTGNAAKTLNVSRSSWLVWTIAIVCSRESPTVSYRSFRKSTMLVPHSSQVFPKETLRNSPERTILAVLFFFFDGTKCRLSRLYYTSVTASTLQYSAEHVQTLTLSFTLVTATDTTNLRFCHAKRSILARDYSPIALL